MCQSLYFQKRTDPGAGAGGGEARGGAVACHAHKCGVGPQQVRSPALPSSAIPGRSWAFSRLPFLILAMKGSTLADSWRDLVRRGA